MTFRFFSMKRKMDKNTLFRFTKEAKQTLESLMAKKLSSFGIEETKLAPVFKAKFPVDELVEQLYNTPYKDAYNNLIEDMAYFFFIRILLIRYLEVNELFPYKIKILKHRTKISKSEIAVLPRFDENIYQSLSEDNASVFAYAFYLLCQILKESFPVLLAEEKEYYYAFFPKETLNQGGALDRFLSKINDDEFKNQTQIIAWMHQHYISNHRQQLRKLDRISTENIPALSQVFTPDWIVSYLAENSLGRWYFSHFPKSKLKANLKFFVQDEKKAIPVDKASLEELKIIEPCCGCGNILVYAFDLLYNMYIEQGYDKKIIPSLIIKNNLYGLDIDKKAARISYFSLMMKACDKDPSFLSRKIRPHVYEIIDSSFIHDQFLDDYSFDPSEKEVIKSLKNDFAYGKTLGSLIKVNQVDFDSLLTKIKAFQEDENLFKLKKLVSIAKILSQKYDILITNPPYLGTSTLEKKVKDIIAKTYPQSKSDLSCMFMQTDLLKANGYMAIVNSDSWMYLSSFYEMRKDIIENESIITMAHLGMGFFDAVVQTTAFVIQNRKAESSLGIYFDLTKSKNKCADLLAHKNCYRKWQEDFLNITNCPIAYHANKETIRAFKNTKTIEDFAYPRQGIATGCNKRNLRYWFEVRQTDIQWDAKDLADFFNSKKRYIPYNKGGSYRKWFYDMEWVIWFDQENYAHLQTVGNHLPSKNFYFKESITWSKVTSSFFSTRYVPQGSVFDVAGCSIFSPDLLSYLLGFTNSVVMQHFMSILSQTLNYEVGNVKSIPLIIDQNKRKEIEDLVNENIFLSKEDLTEKETSHLFRRPLYLTYDTLEEGFIALKKKREERFAHLKRNEERLNQLFLDIYHLDKEIDYHVNDQTISVRRSSYRDDVIDFLSYFVGVSLHRYSLESDTIFDTSSEDLHYLVLTKEAYLPNDIITKLESFLVSIYGRKKPKNNLLFLARGLKKKGNPKKILRNYFLNTFYKDQSKRYYKHPLYWMIDSGKQDGCKILFYYFEYTKETLDTLKTKAVIPLLQKYKHRILEKENKLQRAEKEIVIR